MQGRAVPAVTCWGRADVEGVLGCCSGWMEEVVGVVTGGSCYLTASTLDLWGRGTAPPPSLRRPRCEVTNKGQDTTKTSPARNYNAGSHSLLAHPPSYLSRMSRSLGIRGYPGRRRRDAGKVMADEAIQAEIVILNYVVSSNDGLALLSNLTSTTVTLDLESDMTGWADGCGGGGGGGGDGNGGSGGDGGGDDGGDLWCQWRQQREGSLQVAMVVLVFLWRRSLLHDALSDFAALEVTRQPQVGGWRCPVVLGKELGRR
ncbi:hypothetical protein O3P69_013846 [Scylla paramamosain]|uniref:Uncharacterized protein n=1 Tax=Scylla paramamosain TaxID=85552 RepID=A0AAW0SQY7_SCYPA